MKRKKKEQKQNDNKLLRFFFLQKLKIAFEILLSLSISRIESKSPPLFDYEKPVIAFSTSPHSMYLSGKEEEETIAIFQTVDGDLVIDLTNGSIFATDDTAPTGTYTGLLFGRDNAIANNDNTETGDEFLTKLKLQFSGTTFTWTEEGTVYTGTFKPLHQAVDMGTYQMHGIFYSRVIHPTTGSLMDFCFVKGKNGKLLCAYFDQALSVQKHNYRHGASFQQ